jgi:hypothetical protein
MFSLFTTHKVTPHNAYPLSTCGPSPSFATPPTPSKGASPLASPLAGFIKACRKLTFSGRSKGEVDAGCRKDDDFEVKIRKGVELKEDKDVMGKSGFESRDDKTFADTIRNDIGFGLASEHRWRGYPGRAD